MMSCNSFRVTGFNSLDSCGIQSEMVLNVYLWGSRCWDLDEPGSDYDFIAIVSVKSIFWIVASTQSNTNYFYVLEKRT